MKKQFGYGCEFCRGIVKGKRVDREAFKHKTGFVILEQVLIGVCDQCGSRYYCEDAQTGSCDRIRESQADQDSTRTCRSSGVIVEFPPVFSCCEASVALVSSRANSCATRTGRSRSSRRIRSTGKREILSSRGAERFCSRMAAHPPIAITRIDLERAFRGQLRENSAKSLQIDPTPWLCGFVLASSDT